MAKYVFKGSLSTEGIENIKKQLLKYQQNILPRKIREVVTRLAEIGIPVIEQHMSEASYTYDEKGNETNDPTHYFGAFDLYLLLLGIAGIIRFFNVFAFNAVAFFLIRHGKLLFLTKRDVRNYCGNADYYAIYREYGKALVFGNILK